MANAIANFLSTLFMQSMGPILEHFDNSQTTWSLLFGFMAITNLLGKLIYKCFVIRIYCNVLALTATLKY